MLIFGAFRMIILIGDETKAPDFPVSKILLWTQAKHTFKMLSAS